MSEEVERVKLVELINTKTNEKENYLMSLDILGQGKYGKVYRAVHIDDPNKIFAVKVIALESEKVRK